MNLNINKTIAVLGVVVVALFFMGCTPHNPDDGHDHGEPAEANGEESHGVESTTSLTPDQLKAVGITLGDIELKNLTATIKVNGSLRVPNRNSAHATSLYGGIIKTLNVELGDNVRKGQVIATIENPQFVQLQEEYLTIGSRLILAEQELGRQRELNAGNAGAKKNLQDATSNLAILSARKASLQQQIQLMGIDPSAIRSSSLKNTLVIVSPISGTISNVFAKIGSYVDVSSPIAEIVDNSQLHLDLQVFE
uniref:efflux RND transporter periplasmic adaptor subunit n=1 Tax=Parapedobacter defluvii TaxID=2045106 RepID=UPI003341777E